MLLLLSTITFPKNIKPIHVFTRYGVARHSDILINELRVTSYFYCTSCELLFACELRVIVYGTSYELLFTCELPVTVYSTNYELLLLHELRVIVYCMSYE